MPGHAPHYTPHHARLAAAAFVHLLFVQPDATHAHAQPGRSIERLAASPTLTLTHEQAEPEGPLQPLAGTTLAPTAPPAWTARIAIRQDETPPIPEPPENQDGRFDLRVGRTTDLRDGGLRASGVAPVPGARENEAPPAIFIGPDGERIDVYDVALRVRALGDATLSLGLTGGVRSIQARGGRVQTEDGATVIREDDEFVPIPVAGADVRWRFRDNVALIGSAATHALETDATLLDLAAAAEISLRRNVSLRAGYRYTRTDIDLESLDTQLDDEGLFARIQIDF